MSQKTKTHKTTSEHNARLRCRIQYIAADRCNDKIFNTAGEIFETRCILRGLFREETALEVKFLERKTIEYSSLLSWWTKGMNY